LRENNKANNGMKIILKFLLILLVMWPVYVQSQEPPPAPLKANKEQQNKPSPKKIQANNDQRGTNDFPLVVKIVEAPTTKPEKGNDAERGNKEPSSDWWKIIFDGLLCLFTGVLAISTIALWWSTRKVWKATEKSANIAYKAFITANRPHLRIRHIHSDPKILPVWVNICNVGGSNATSIELHAVFALRRGNVKEAPWTENLSKSIWHGPTILAPREEAPYELRSKPDVDIDSYDTSFAIAAGEILLIIGEVRYKDANETERKTSFGWSYDLSAREFSKAEKEDQYNYED
jgi:hypothetical protein